ncbi:MAG TPA: SDR family NAD(P)-dependent oxidoreductase [Verrucomicrobiae bacterium]|jgi:ketoreductase|nr:SDR family NAD(P)-dependent oxidoreductase [Verrucomicrobiae bacterium]
MTDLSGKIALVTGGGTGIGKAIAEALAESGARVAVASRNPSHLQFAKADGSFIAIEMDVRNKAQVQTGVGKISERLGPIDILINNAGVSGLTTMDDPEDGRWRDIIETNLTGSYLVTKEVLKFMKNNTHGRIINVSSVLGKFGVPGYAAYCSAKHGIIGFTRAVALEVVGRGITVNAICPGWVETDMARQGIEESAAFEGITAEAFRKRAVEMVPIKRFLDADEIAGLVLYLVSKKASGITGQAINICGGQTMV